MIAAFVQHVDGVASAWQECPALSFRQSREVRYLFRVLVTAGMYTNFNP